MGDLVSDYTSWIAAYAERDAARLAMFALLPAWAAVVTAGVGAYVNWRVVRSAFVVQQRQFNHEAGQGFLARLTDSSEGLAAAEGSIRVFHKTGISIRKALKQGGQRRKLPLYLDLINSDIAMTEYYINQQHLLPIALQPLIYLQTTANSLKSLTIEFMKDREFTEEEIVTSASRYRIIVGQLRIHRSKVRQVRSNMTFHIAELRKMGPG